MATNAQAVIRRVVDTAQDPTSVRWPLRELVRYLNDGQREMVIYRPDATTTNATLTLVAGAKQAVPAAANRLIDVVRNNPAGSGGRSVRQVRRDILDASAPSWHTETGAPEILNYVYDARDPKVFYVYPPATTAAKLDIVYSAMPTDIVAPADASVLPADSATDTSSPAVVLGAITIADSFSAALVDYILYRAYTKDSEYAGDAARATAHYAAFVNVLGVEVKSGVGVAPIVASVAAPA